uniref:V-type proton ATPase subunit G n=1 Tax=Rhabditophanes sp. KR3021 TaxID=114890 RepID=A0AC35TWH5_9BILA
MESIDEGLEVTVIQDKCKGNSLNGANYDYQRQAMLANQKKLEEGMRLKEIHYQKELAEKEALACAEQDYFKDMAPKIKIKKINVIKKVQETAKKSDLFLIQEKDSDVPEVSF